jgi:hypothetical protein
MISIKYKKAIAKNTFKKNHSPKYKTLTTFAYTMRVSQNFGGGILVNIIFAVMPHI